MKTITFKPLRRIKKTGKICVANYLKWRELKINCNKYRKDKILLDIDDSYRYFPDEELVYNHKGENLFWRDFAPEEITIITGHELEDGEQIYPKRWKTEYGFYSGSGIDCEGVPAFSHYDQVYVAKHFEDISQFEPLKVGVVKKWYGWFLLNLLENFEIKTNS